jgi:synaptosomal-associated protein 29
MKVDKINADTKVSQRHLNGIKSIFGGIKNWWNGEGKKDDAPVPPTGQLSRDRQQLRSAIASAPDRADSGLSGTHPALRLRSDDVKGFYDDDIVEFGDVSSRSHVTTQRDVTDNGASRQVASSSTSTRSAAFQEYEKNLNSNLGIDFVFILVRPTE